MSRRDRIGELAPSSMAESIRHGGSLSAFPQITRSAGEDGLFRTTGGTDSSMPGVIIRVLTEGGICCRDHPLTWYVYIYASRTAQGESKNSHSIGN
jgi:hypothetical protein